MVLCQVYGKMINKIALTEEETKQLHDLLRKVLEPIFNAINEREKLSDERIRRKAIACL